MDLEQLLYELMHSFNTDEDAGLSKFNDAREMPYLKGMLQQKLPPGDDTWNAGFNPGPFRTSGNTPSERVFRALTAGNRDFRRDDLSREQLEKLIRGR